MVSTMRVQLQRTATLKRDQGAKQVKLMAAGTAPAHELKGMETDGSL